MGPVNFQFQHYAWHMITGTQMEYLNLPVFYKATDARSEHVNCLYLWVLEW